MRFVVRCPAKVNLFLAVGPPDHAGWHPLRTVFQAIGLFDELHIEEGVPATTVTSDWPDLPIDNTLAKVLRLAAELTDLPPLKIELHKRIPAQSGLGGGSSDAAGLLRALGRLTDGRISARAQFEIARAVGADVPFFLNGGTAKGEGYGDQITPMDDFPKRWVVLAKPSVGCETKDAYQRLDAEAREWREIPDPIRHYNDFERVAPMESLASIGNLRCLGASPVGLCGSGSAVYGMFDDEELAQNVAAVQGRGEWPKTWCVPTLTRAESV